MLNLKLRTTSVMIRKALCQGVRWNLKVRTIVSAQSSEYILWFKDTSMADLAKVGGKNASLGEMYQELMPLGVRVPDGFAVTVKAFEMILASPSIRNELHELLDNLDTSDMKALSQAGARARDIVYGAPMPTEVERQIREAYRSLLLKCGDSSSVAVRSSATAEDLPTASFAGQHESFLNIKGESLLIDAVKRCQASLFTDRAISYRVDNKFDHFKVFLSVGIQKMIRSDLACSGTLFTIDTESGHPDVVFINGAWGLGENIVQGLVDPDEYYVHKPTFKKGFKNVLSKKLGKKEVHMVYTHGRNHVANRPTPIGQRGKFCLEDDGILELADSAIKIEEHYSKLAGHPRPMDIEWAKDGPDGKIFILQARPETVISQQNALELEEYILDGIGKVRVTGRAVGSKIAKGTVRILKDSSQLASFKPGDVLVADSTTPDWEPLLKIAAAVVTNRGGRTCHAAIIARELNIPAVVGAEHATDTLHDGDTVTVSCAEGAVGKVLEGDVKFHRYVTNLTDIPRPKTKIMVNLGNPEMAFKVSSMPCDGVGLARMEFIISEHIKAHPMALLHPERIKNIGERKKVLNLLKHYPDGANFFIEKLSGGIGIICAAFYPRPVIVRLSDFKTNEYASLMGGRDFELHEENPMIGFRGASRYTHPAYEEAFALECAALKRVRDNGFTNMKLMVPFCRTLVEARKVINAMSENGLKRGENGLEIYMMCEIPNNVILIDEFAELFDGFSIGSNDLTQLTLGIDRDSSILADAFDEQDPGMTKMLELAVRGARRNHRHSGICGQAPSDHIEVARFLVGLGIDSISLSPDRVLRTMVMMKEIEVTQDAALGNQTPPSPPSHPPPSRHAQFHK